MLFDEFRAGEYLFMHLRFPSGAQTMFSQNR